MTVYSGNTNTAMHFGIITSPTTGFYAGTSTKVFNVSPTITYNVGVAYVMSYSVSSSCISFTSTEGAANALVDRTNIYFVASATALSAFSSVSDSATTAVITTLGTASPSSTIPCIPTITITPTTIPA